MSNETRTLGVILQLMEEFRKINPEIQMQAAAAFVTAAMYPEATLQEIADRLGVSGSSVTRNLRTFAPGKVRVSGKVRDGHGLLTVHEDPMDRRKRFTKLTPAGRRVIQSAIHIMERMNT